MEKVGRNDPCPCGSGKKYKKCHGRTNVIEINPDRYNYALDGLHQGLIEFAVDNYQAEMETFIAEQPKPNIIDDQFLIDSFMSGLTTWFILNNPIYHGQTIFDLYYEKLQDKVKYERVRKAFETWKDAIHSIFRVTDVTNEKITLKDIRSDNVFSIRSHEDRILEEEDVLLGILLPYVQCHEFLLTEIDLIEGGHTLFDTLKSYDDKLFRKEFPQIVRKLIENEQEEGPREWMHPSHEAVADVFVHFFKNKVQDYNYIDTGLHIWKKFAEATHPIIRKPEVYAAALDYVLQMSLFEDDMQSQKEIAKEYGVNPNSISRNVDKIFAAIDVFMDEDDELEDIPASTTIEMEEMMRDLQKHLNEMEFDSQEEMEAYVDELLQSQIDFSSEPNSSRDIAQDKLYQAYEAKGEVKKKLINDALKIYPNSPDAYLLKAREAKTSFEEYQLLHQALIAGEKDLGKTFFKENKGHFWGLTETRPYMRAKEMFAIHLYNNKNETEAIKHFKELLELNPNDNQGIRYQLLTINLEMKKFHDAKKLLKQYESDGSVYFLFNHALLAYFIEGLTGKTKKLIKEAVQKYPTVKEYLLLERKNPLKANSYHVTNTANDAYIYAERHRNLWADNKQLLDELEKY